MPTPSPTQVPYSCLGCGATPTPTLPPGQVEIPQTYQGNNRGRLAWQVYTPSPSPSPGVSPPGIVMVHGSGWNAGKSGDIQGQSKDLARHGYYVVSVNYKLAPCGVIPEQPCHADDGTTAGWWVNREVQDVEAFVTALRGSGKVNPDKIGIVGGSAGATLVALVVSDTTSTNGFWPFWNASVRPACAVLLSGAYDFSDRKPTPGQILMAPMTIKLFENFAQSGLPATQKSLSPVAKVKTPTTQEPFVPMFMIHSQYDPTVPYPQLDDMRCTLANKGVPLGSYKVLVLWNSDLHSFHLWQSCDEVPPAEGAECKMVSDDVIEYLDDHLK